MRHAIHQISNKSWAHLETLNYQLCYESGKHLMPLRPMSFEQEPIETVEQHFLKITRSAITE